MKPNVIFILLDAVRCDRLHKSKEFLELQKEGTLLDNVTTTAPYTCAAMHSIFSGLFGKENGVNGYYKMLRLKDSVPFLPETFQQNGYFTSCDLLTKRIVPSRGFDIHQCHDEFKDDLLKRHTELLKKCFEQADGKPIFSFLHFTRIHAVAVSKIIKKYEWNDPKFYERRKENLENYDMTFIEAAKYAKKIKEVIDELGKSNDTILIFFSDHGTGIGERFGEINHGVFTYEETVRTFYLFIGPSIVKNQASSKLLSAIDLYPTIKELCNLVSDFKLPGTSFYQYLLGRSNEPIEESYTYSETGGLQGPFPSPMKHNVFCVKSPRYKLIFFQDSNEFHLYDLINDPLESSDLYGKELSIENELKENLLNWINR